ncbi:T6SS immunity protein Tli4 family protein [Stenotrophomonas sp.]|uniref:T6SS immunity protein Tli4 family protein n=1 Tax=Stenotrophomonas sp. TaxID=69392 RepID=UPI0028A647DE|nr:T6SS immunity protein Tli4 family protein [Stenotrophomonas sp.]
MKIVKAVLITLATLLGPAGCDASTPSSAPHSGPVVEERLQQHMPRLQTTRDFRPTWTPGSTRECLGRLVFEVDGPIEWALDPLRKVEDNEPPLFPDGVPGDRRERMGYGVMRVMVSQPATEEVMEMHRDRYQFADRGASVAAWTRTVAEDEAIVEEARARGDSELTVGWYELQVEESKKKLETARNRRIHNFGFPGELATESGTGRLAVRTLLGGNVISLVAYVNSEEGNPLREEAMAKIRRDIKRMRLRAPGEVPDEPGVCFPGLFFADDGTTDYHAHASFRYLDRPNVAYSIDTGYRPAPEEGEGIAKQPISNWRQVLAYPGVLLTMPADDVQRRDVVKPGGILAGGLSFDKTGIAITREGDTKRDPSVRTYQLYAGMPGIEGVQAMPFVSMTMQGWSQQTYPQLKQQPPPLEESEKRFDAILHNLHLRHTTPEMPDYERLLGKQIVSPE